MKRVIRAVALVLLIPIGSYLLSATLMSRIPANTDWREPDTGTTIFVQSNGVHTGIVLPAGPGKWRAYGWGDREFYLSTPRWQDIRPGTAVSALIGSGDTLVHVDELDDFLPDENWRPLRLRPAEYARLTNFIKATFEPAAEPIPGYTPRDRFYPARGHYSALRTCNAWTGDALRHAGVRVGLWTPFAGDVMRWVPNPVAETPRR